MNNIGLLTKEVYLPKEVISTEIGVNAVRYELTSLSGMNTKFLNTKEAAPQISLTADPSHASRILFIEPLGIGANFKLNEEGEPVRRLLGEDIDILKANPALKIIWTEEQHLLRWSSHNREKLFELSEMIACCNKYQQRMLTPSNRFLDTAKDPLPMTILRTPINENLYKSADVKEPKIVAMGKICHEKNINGVIELFKALPSSFEKVYMGSHQMWNEQVNPESVRLEMELKTVVDRLETYETREEVARELSTAWGYFNVSIYDVGCLSFLEAAMAGCYCFAWDLHPMFDEYAGVYRFKDYTEGAALIESTFESVGLEPATVSAMYVRDYHSYPAFISQLKKLTAEVLLDV